MTSSAPAAIQTVDPPQDRPREVQNRTLVSTTVLLALGLVSILVTPAGRDSVWNGAICLSIFGLAGVATARIHGRLNEGLAGGMLMPWFAGVFTLTYGVSTLAWLGQPIGDQAIITQDSIRSAVTLAAVGFTCALFGYMAGVTFASASVPRMGRWFTGRPAEPTLAGAWILLLIWAICSFLEIRQGNVGYLQNVASIISNPSPFAQALSLGEGMGLLGVATAAWGHAKYRSFGWRMTLAISVVSLGAFGLLSGTKESLVLLGLSVVLGRASFRRRLPATRIVIVFAVILAIVVPIVTAYRQVIAENPGQRLSVSYVLNNIGAIWSQTKQVNGLQSQEQRGPFQTFLWREARISDLGIIVQRTPSEIPYAPVSQLTEAPIVGLVPRLIWPGKPVLATGLDFSHEYYNIPKTVYTSSAATPIGDLYMHGGYWVVIMGMLILGFVLSIIDAAGARLGDPRWIFLVITLFPILLKQEIDYVSMLAALPYNLLAIALAMRLVRFGAPTAPREAGSSVASRR